MKEVILIFQMIAMLLEQVSVLGYQQMDVTVYDYPQKIYWLEAAIEKGISVEGVLAGDSVFGFETIGLMANRNNATAAVNGMFFDDLGSPAGLYCNKGKWIRIGSIGTPSLLIEKNKASIQEIEVKAFWKSEKTSGEIYSYNVGGFEGLANLFSKEFGETNRVFRPQVSYRIENGKVVERYLTDMPVAVGNGYLLTYLLDENVFRSHISWQNLPKTIPQYQIGDRLEIEFQTYDEKRTLIYPDYVSQSGGWLLRNGKNIAKNKEEFIGYTTSLQPRTVVGISKQNKLVFVVVDGRRKHQAEGMTGKWLAEFLEMQGMRDAVYLDGGASSAMWLRSGIVNQPAYTDIENGKEIAHAILLQRISAFFQYKK